MSKIIIYYLLQVNSKKNQKNQWTLLSDIATLKGFDKLIIAVDARKLKFCLQRKHAAVFSIKLSIGRTGTSMNGTRIFVLIYQQVISSSKQNQKTKKQKKKPKHTTKNSKKLNEKTTKKLIHTHTHTRTTKKKNNNKKNKLTEDNRSHFL